MHRPPKSPFAREAASFDGDTDGVNATRSEKEEEEEEEGIVVENDDEDEQQRQHQNYAGSTNHSHFPPRSSTPGGQSAKSSSSRPSTPNLRSGEHAELGVREFMEDATVVIENRTVANSEELVSFYGVFDGHGGKTISTNIYK